MRIHWHISRPPILRGKTVPNFSTCTRVHMVNLILTQTLILTLLILLNPTIWPYFSKYIKTLLMIVYSAFQWRFLKPRLHDTTSCQTGCQSGLTTGCIVYTNIHSCIQPVVKPVVQRSLTTGWTNSGCSFRLNEQWLFVQHGCQPGCQTGLTTGWMFVYTIQPIVKPVVQPVVSCKRGIINYSLATVYLKYICRRLISRVQRPLRPASDRKSTEWAILCNLHKSCLSGTSHSQNYNTYRLFAMTSSARCSCSVRIRWSSSDFRTNNFFVVA